MGWLLIKSVPHKHISMTPDPVLGEFVTLSAERWLLCFDTKYCGMLMEVFSHERLRCPVSYACMLLFVSKYHKCSSYFLTPCLPETTVNHNISSTVVIYYFCCVNSPLHHTESRTFYSTDRRRHPDGRYTHSTRKSVMRRTSMGFWMKS